MLVASSSPSERELDFAMLSASNAVVGDACALLLATISEVYCHYVSFDEPSLSCMCFLARMKAINASFVGLYTRVLAEFTPHSHALEYHVNAFVGRDNATSDECKPAAIEFT